MIEVLVLIAVIAGLVFALPAIRRWVRTQDAGKGSVDEVLADHERRIAALEQENKYRSL